MRIVVDVMGGDHGCGVVIAGVKQALEADSKITQLFLVGKQDEIESALREGNLRDDRIKVVHASEVLTMEDKPLEGIRRKKDCSMVRAIGLVHEGQADAVISPGNTGALVAGSLRLRRLEGVERPALAARMPSRTGDFVLIDAGANPVCEPLQLAQFAVMGSVYAKSLGKENPRVGVLSNGSEDSKGTEVTREAKRLCSLLDLNFIGYVEGFHLFDDAVDVVVTDGFTGNIVLKTAESLGYAMMHILKKELTASPVTGKFGAMLSKGAFINLKKRMDPELYGGAVLLGLNGIVIKTHGSSRARAITNAIRVAAEEIRHDVNKKLLQQIAIANQKLAAKTNVPNPIAA